MAGKRKKNGRISRGGRIALRAFAALLLALACAFGAAALNAGVLRVRRAEVELRDLPAAFDGATILYASDIDLFGMNAAAKAEQLFEQLQSLRPDMLLLGGDYTSPPLTELLRSPDGKAQSAAQRQAARADFFRYIGAFDAPLGKYAVAAPEDGDWDALRRQMAQAGIQPLFNDRVAVRRGDDALWIVGVSEEVASLNAAGSSFSQDDCVLVAAYSPTLLPLLLTSEAQDSGAWVDLALTGHTHGGQIRLFGRTALQLSRQEQRYRYGWTVENGLPILTTSGVGCEGANLRLGTEPEVWLITLRKSE